ncbi:outer membrane homotrimeric porin [Fundidesulfovibrio agrisoli]|uniref:outer membrane homotrimeric porin n=1 Tax=Fundidesulfovibrio agrisoli TaxID=2922717 RepID=UPI001FAD13A3
MNPPSRFFLILVALLAWLAAAAPARAVEVRMGGEHYVYAASFVNRNFTGWSADGSQTEDAFTLWQRTRLRLDLTSGENLGFSLWAQVQNTPWGNSTLTVDNPAVAVQIFKAYLLFKVPGTGIEAAAGKLTVTLPQSEAFSGSIVLDSELGALTAKAPLGESASITLGYGRPLGYVNALENVAANPRDVLDLFFAALPVTGEAISATPWLMAGLFANNGANTPYQGAGGPPDLGYIRQDMLSIGYFERTPGFRQSCAPYFWAGSSFKLGLERVSLYADAAAGLGGAWDAPKNRRRGVFMDAAASYDALGFMAPRLFGWWSSGEDADVRGGSERMPALVRTWNAGASYLFSTGQVFDNTTSTNACPVGAWGLGASLDAVSIIPELTSRLTAVYARGANDPKALRRAVELTGENGMAQMGRHLSVNEHLIGVNFDHTWAVCDGLKIVVETGWAHAGGLQRSIWGRRFTDAARDSWKAAWGLLYTF